MAFGPINQLDSVSLPIPETKVSEQAVQKISEEVEIDRRERAREERNAHLLLTDPLAYEETIVSGEMNEGIGPP